MLKFDCLSNDVPLFGPHFLEASAGTGKTFAIEHIVARLLLQKIDLSQILVVTFTKAATRELKLRIRSNLEKIYYQKAHFPYLPIHEDSQTLNPIGDALSSFEQNQIFTIHGFCSRILSEFSLPLDLPDFQMNQSSKIDSVIKDFFEMGLTKEIICPEQLHILLQSVGGVKELALKLKNTESDAPFQTFAERHKEFAEAFYSNAPVPILDLDLLTDSYKKVEGDIKLQYWALNNPSDPKSFQILIREKGSIFKYLSIENQKVRAKDKTEIPFFRWGQKALLPLIEKAASPREIFNDVYGAWRPTQNKFIEQEGFLSPDTILKMMHQAIQNPQIASQIQQKYKAVLIDEFQDTDPIQWEIFQTLFSNHTDAFYLIGDPKQSIYRFRNADLYTYLKAKESFSLEHQYFLDTNYRSEKSLIQTLNHLFDRDWLYLPKKNQNLPFTPVKAGLTISKNFEDSKGALHLFIIHPDEIYSYVIQEILQLKEKTNSYHAFAILVKDRYQAAKMKQKCKEANIAAIFKTQELLSTTYAFEAFYEFFVALSDPKNLKKTNAVLAGPFFNFSIEMIQSLQISPLYEYRKILDEKGFVILCQTLCSEKLIQIASHGSEFYSDCLAMIEELLEWEQMEGFSFPKIFDFFTHILESDPNDAPHRKNELQEDAIQIMTMHASKGLEFEIVFAIGLSAKSPTSDEEEEAEKLRQLYVTMTRAKFRLYVPIPSNFKTNETASPIELFFDILFPKKNWEEGLKNLSTFTSLTIEEIQNPIQLPIVPVPAKPLCSPSLKAPIFHPSYFLSYTSISKQNSMEVLEKMEEPNGIYTLHNLPRGSETGIYIHKIFEVIFSKRIWNADPQILDTLDSILFQTPLYDWKHSIFQMIKDVLHIPLSPGFSLAMLTSESVLVETEFLFKDEPHYFRGFIDLFVVYDQKIYLIDWKTNWLGKDALSYCDECMQKAIDSHDYQTQASIYHEAIQRLSLPYSMGGVYYFFIRGPRAIQLKSDEKTWKKSN